MLVRHDVGFFCDLVTGRRPRQDAFNRPHENDATVQTRAFNFLIRGYRGSALQNLADVTRLPVGVLLDRLRRAALIDITVSEIESIVRRPNTLADASRLRLNGLE